MYSNPAQSALAGPAVQAKQPVMTEHAQRLHGHAETLETLNGRLSSVLDRMHGPQPEAVADAKVQPAPNGVLYVAQFGAERIGIEIDRFAQLVGRLEQVA